MSFNYVSGNSSIFHAFSRILLVITIEVDVIHSL